jgi:hypothetical protein
MQKEKQQFAQLKNVLFLDSLSEAFFYDVDLARAITSLFNWRLRLLAWRYRAMRNPNKTLSLSIVSCEK